MSVNSLAPCRGCNCRAVDCHSTCADYTAWRIIFDRKKEVVLENRLKYKERFLAETRFPGSIPNMKRRKQT